MAQSWKCRQGLLVLLSSLAIPGLALILPMGRALTQVVPDRTLGAERSVVTPRAGITNFPKGVDVISGGATRGANLFHSFAQFSVVTGGAAYFNNAVSIQNIISRVTGASVSNINGLIAANGKANLFLINPNGIVFGPNAALNVGGSFVASTASSLKFADGTEFSASNPPTSPLLTVSVPIGLQFGTNPGSILNQSQATDTSGNIVGLQVMSGKTLVLAGGDITLEGGSLRAPDGRIELGSVAANSLVNLRATDKGWALEYNGVQNFQNIQLMQNAYVDASGEGGGDIQIQGKIVMLTDGSQIFTDTQGAGRGGFLTVTATDSIELSGTTPDGQFPNGLFAETNQGATGSGGNLTINTGRLSVSGGAEVSTSTNGMGNGGNLTVNASDVELSETAANGQFSSGLFTETSRGSTGSGGDLVINTGHLSVSNGAQVGAGAFSRGNAGSLTVNASDVELSGTTPDGQYPSGLFTQTSRGSTGSGGDLTINTGRLSISNAAQVGASTFGRGNAGSLTVNASDVELSGTAANGQLSSSLAASANPGSTGSGGNITINTGRLSVSNGAEVGAGTFSQGNAGSLTVNASDVELSGTTPDGQSPSGLFTETRRGSTGSGGDLTINTGHLSVSSGARASASTSGQGNAGSLTVNASDVELSGTAANGQLLSTLAASTSRGATGFGGNITVTTGQLIVRNKAQIAVSSLGSGKAGTLETRASSTLLDNQGQITADSTAGQGNINLFSGDLILRRGSRISTNATGTEAGGNITISTNNLVAIPSEGSDISANATSNFGGKVTISTQSLTGFQVGQKDPSFSNITASSTLGPQFSGTVQINTPNVNPSNGLVTLPVAVVDPSRLVAQGCGTGNQKASGRFIVTGRGGLPPNPSDTISSDAILDDMRLPTTTVSKKGSATVATTSPSAPETIPIVPATGVVFNGDEATLIAAAPTATLQIPWLSPTACRAYAS